MKLTKSEITEFVDIAEHQGSKLLSRLSVLRWLNGDLEFLTKGGTRKMLKVAENKWGISLLSETTGNTVKKEWSGIFGEAIVKELFELLGANVQKPNIKDVSSVWHDLRSSKRKTDTVNPDVVLPDLETDTSLIEVKTQTFGTPGTATDKIPSVPYLYANACNITQKTLIIVAVAEAEYYCERKQLIRRSEDVSSFRKEIFEMYYRHGIQFVGATDLIRKIIIMNKK